MVTVALAGDTMLGRLVGDLLREQPDARLVGDDVREVVAEADLFHLNLECCISERGQPWADPGKPFFFRAPPGAVDVLTGLGVDAVTLANNHALDYGTDALVDTFDHLDAAGIGHLGAGRDLTEARRPLVCDIADTRLTLVAATDHPADFAAAGDRPGTAFAELGDGAPTWLEATVADAAHGAEVTLATVHWGPNMTSAPVRHVRAAAERLVEAGATVIAGHSAHVFHGVAWRPGPAGPACVLYDLGDFVDDYAVDPVLRNDLGLLWLVRVEDDVPRQVEAVPLTLELRATHRAEGDEHRWIERRLTEACASLGSHVASAGDRLVVQPG